MEVITDLGVDLTRVVIVEAAEGRTVAEQHSAVRDVQGVHRDGCLLTDRSAHREVEGRVLGKIFSGIQIVGGAVMETGAVVDIGRGADVPGQRGPNRRRIQIFRRRTDQK